METAISNAMESKLTKSFEIHNLIQVLDMELQDLMSTLLGFGLDLLAFALFSTYLFSVFWNGNVN